MYEDGDHEEGVKLPERTTFLIDDEDDAPPQHKQLEQQHQLVLLMQEELLRERATIAHLQEQVRTVHTTNCGTREKVPLENAY